jgi:hypothetical protein
MYPTVGTLDGQYGGSMPRALGLIYATDAGPKVRLTDGSVWEMRRLGKQKVRGLNPQNSLE